MASRTLHLGDVLNRANELAPRPALLGKRLAAPRRQPVITPPPLPGLLQPSPFNPAALFEPVEHGIEGRDVKFNHATRAFLDQLRDLVAVPRACFDQR